MTTDIETSDAWIRAQDRYIQDLNEEEQRMFFRASPESFLDDAITAEKSHGMNSATRGVMEKLQPFVAAIEQYGDAVDVYSSTYSLALGPIWGSIKVLLHVCTQDPESAFFCTILIEIPSRSRTNSANTLTNLLKCSQELAMSCRALELMRGSSPTMKV